uniref:Sodium-dependent phosphate transporter n=1 Tax=Romanomermis culicivorax TaxID=13658 RepID=A0A915K3H3_ROMCU
MAFGNVILPTTGKEIANIFKSNEILKNPIADVMIGLLFTTVLHSSTVTTISVVMVNAQALTVQQGVYIAMGANVGTAVTTMIVALFESSQNQEFGRAFSAATIHCIYNWMGLITFFPIEWIMQLSTGKGFLNWFSQWLVGNVAQLNSSSKFQYDLIGRIVDPFTTRIMQVDNEVISELLQGKNVSRTIRKELCVYGNGTAYKCTVPELAVKTRLKSCVLLGSFLLNINLSDKTLGGILLVAALIILVCCMVGNIKVLSELLGGHVQTTVKKLLNFQKAAAHLHIDQIAIQRIVKEHELKAYCATLVHSLPEDDYGHHMDI